MPLEYFSLPYTNREITGWVRGAGYCKFSFSSYTCSSFSIISLMYHLPWKDLPLTYWYHSQQWVNLPPSQSWKPFHLAFWIFRERFAFSGKECKRSDTTEIMICLEQSWIGTMCMSKHGNECHIVGFIQPLIQEKDFTAMVTLLVWQAIDVTENNQLAPKSETKSNNKDTQDYPLKKKKSLKTCIWFILQEMFRTLMAGGADLSVTFECHVIRPFQVSVLSNVTGPALTWSHSYTHAS